MSGAGVDRRPGGKLPAPVRDARHSRASGWLARTRVPSGSNWCPSHRRRGANLAGCQERFQGGPHNARGYRAPHAEWGAVRRGPFDVASSLWPAFAPGGTSDDGKPPPAIRHSMRSVVTKCGCRVGPRLPDDLLGPDRCRRAARDIGSSADRQADTRGRSKDGARGRQSLLICL